MMKSRFSFWSSTAMALLIAAILTAGACAQTPTPQTPKPTTAPSPAPVSSPTATPKPTPAPSPKPVPTVPASQPKYGGVLNYPIAVFPTGYDIHRKPSYGGYVTRLIFSNLVNFDPTKPELSPKNMLPDLALRWEVSQDGKTWTFFLRKDVKWHDGKPFTADDVVYTMDKLKDPKRSAISSIFGNLSKTEKADDFTVKMTLSAPSASFFVQLANVYASVQPKHLANVDLRSTDFLVGTGPYKVSKITPGVSIEVVKNPNYFKKDETGKQLPYLDGVTLYVISDRTAMVTSIAGKRLDMTTPGPGIGNQQAYDQLLAQAKGMTSVWFRPSYGDGIWYNTTRGPLKDVRVRKALSLIIDRQQWHVAGWGAAEFGNYDHAWFSGTYGLTKAEIDQVTGWNRPQADRVAEAKKLMADAGYASGFQLKFPTSKVAEIQRMEIWVADQWRQYFNIQTDNTPYDNAQLFELRDKGDFDVSEQATLAFLVEPDEMMPYFKTGPANFSGYSNKDLDDLWVQQSQAMDLAKRQELTKKIERQLLTDWPGVPEPFSNYVTAYWPYVKGFVVMEANQAANLAFERVWLDK